MLILAGITLNLTLGEHGIFKTANGAVKNYINASQKEVAELNALEQNLKTNNNDINNAGNKRQYLLVEVNGYLDGGCATINELSLYDSNNNKIEYNILKDLEYDSMTKEKSYYWENASYHNYTNLNDGQTSNQNATDEGANVTVLLYKNSERDNSNSEDWVRFIIDVGEHKDIKQIKVNVGSYLNRIPENISIYKVNAFIDGIEDGSTYKNNVAKRNNNGLTKISQIEFSENVISDRWYYFIEEELKDVKARYLLVEVNGFIDGRYAHISELSLYDRYKDKISYDVLKDLQYDTVTNGKSYYWENMKFYNYTNLNDEQTSNNTDAEEGANVTLFLYKSGGMDGPNSEDWARFIIDLRREYYIEDINMWIGGINGGTPENINIYSIDNFVDGTEENTTYTNNVKQRNNTGLKLISTKTFTEAQDTVQKYSFNINK